MYRQVRAACRILHWENKKGVRLDALLHFDFEFRAGGSIDRWTNRWTNKKLRHLAWLHAKLPLNRLHLILEP